MCGRYEYTTAALDFSDPDTFNALGACGWELVTVMPVDTLIVGVFKRHLPESPLQEAMERLNAPLNAPFGLEPQEQSLPTNPFFMSASMVEAPIAPPVFPPLPVPAVSQNIQFWQSGNGGGYFYHYP